MSEIKNRIVVNPEGKRTAERLLIHELDHAIRKYFDSEGKPATRIYLDAIEGVDQATRDRITEAYKKTAKPGEVAATVMDETNAYYAEQVLGNKYTLEKLIEAEPTLKDKILSFFKGASTDYADVPKLSGAAKKYYRTYKKLFDEFSARNAQSNATENAHLSTLFAENAQKTPLTNMKQEDMSVSDRQYAFTDSESGTAHDSLLQYDDELRSIIENRGDTIIDTYDKLKSTVKEAFEKPDNKSTAFLGIIDAETLQKIKNNIPNLPKELEGTLFKEGKQYSIALTMDSIRHMVDEKGLTEADIIDYIDKIADVIIDHDSVNFDYYIKGKNRTPGLLFKKSFADGTVITFDLVSQNKRSLLMQTLYMESSDYQKKKSAKSLPMQNASGNTSKTQVGQTSDNSIPDNSKKVNTSTKKSSKQYALDIETVDREYLSAVERGDMETAQRMVDEAAKKAGYTYKGMHGTSADFSTFDYSYIGDDNKLGLGFYFTNNENLQFEYDYKKTAYLKINNPIFDNNPTLDDILRREEELREKGFSQEETLKAIQNEFGYDGIVAEYNRKALVAFNPEQIKSADPVTYDDNGRVIPLSERFNERNPDIRYALDIDSEGDNISGAEVMSWLRDKPDGDGKLDLEATVARGLPYKRGRSDLTVGEIRKVIANTTHEKVYSKGEAMKVVKKLSGTWGLTQRARDEIADTVWQFLNEAPDVEYRRDMA